MMSVRQAKLSTEVQGFPYVVLLEFDPEKDAATCFYVTLFYKEEGKQHSTAFFFWQGSLDEILFGTITRKFPRFCEETISRRKVFGDVVGTITIGTRLLDCLYDLLSDGKPLSLFEAARQLDVR